uniref:Uncharacterized protein n=1 Tax=Nelumbo nucifera TaxID=4432 RepID=A0A822XV64_NELNU|nr:TPA_asm: hypothetical protein HUJ06_024442 [Nelumbo nucifera]
MGTIHTHYLIRRGRLLSLLSLTLSCIVSNSHEETIRRNQISVDFLFGTSTSAYQTEGAILEDGRGLSNWDVFSHIPGKIETGENADTADDHYHLYLQDIDLMHSLGVNAYRFSISWARILPRNIIDNLLLWIEPFVTLYHHDLPQELEDSYGGWLSPLIQEDFGYFAEIYFKKFGDRVKYWNSLNEPNLYAHLAYLRGMYAPGRRSEMEPFTVLHNMLLSHGRAAYLYRSC